MGDEILSKVAIDLLSIPPLVFRIIRKKLIKTTLADSDVDIKYPHFEILRLLDQAGTLHVAEIGDQLEIAKAQMTHLIDRLVELELVDRVTDTTDRRIINISLTEKGKQLTKAHGMCIINAVRENMSSLDENELESLCNSLRNVRDSLLKLDQ